ncbi:PREDICTED: uncharacterized protein LOC109328875 isoform X2 [Lupinus angustifolius]|uniref:uncharacterized protein LOC109328875 isoform X2 n=1 Tax=Lupinus angustifolius TaxID=3871 RepID=UPI00092F947C|nr:PREDICTED: uncharacterized protein LOC109328875 isoform X2 [Lupinus angustifolius]
MESSLSSTSISTPIPSSPPPPPHSQPRRPHQDTSPPPETSFYHRVADKRRKLEANRDGSLIYGFDLRPTATALLHSNDVEPLRIFIDDFTQTPIKRKHSKKKVFDSLALHYPNSFLLKLSKLLSINPPIHIRNEVVSLLHETIIETHGNDYDIIRCDMFIELKPLILESFKIELQERLLPQLAKIIMDLAARIYKFGIRGWVELLEYIVSCIYSDSDDELKLKKGLMLLADLPCNAVENEEFWKNHYGALHVNLVNRLLAESDNEDLQALIFDSMFKMLGIAQPLEEYEIGDSILLILLEFIDQHSKEEIVVKRVQDLVDFVSMDVDVILSGKEGIVFRAMLRIVEKNDASRELRCAAIQVLKELSELRWDIMGKVIYEISDANVARVIMVSLSMMFESNEQSSKLGQFLLNLLSFNDGGILVVRAAAVFLRTRYAASRDWKEYHRGMIIVAAFADERQNDISGSVFTTELMKIMTDEINHIREKAQEDGNPETAKRGSEYLPDEKTIQSIMVLISATIMTFKDRLSPYADELFSAVAKLWGHDIPDRVKAIAVSLFNIIVPHFPDKWQMYLDIYSYELLKSRGGSLHAQWESARGIGICAKFGGHSFKTIVNVAMLKLYSLIEYGLSIKGEKSENGANIFDMAVSAIGKICEFHRESIDGPEVIRGWLNCLPLTNDPIEARIVHEQLSEMLRRKDADVLGPKKENLPKIISILRALLIRREVRELATKKTFSELVKFLDKHGEL